MFKTPLEAINAYKGGILTQSEMKGFLQNLLCEDNVSEIMSLLMGLRNTNHARDFVIQVLDMIAAINSGERIFTWDGPDFTDQEKESFKQRLMCMIKYVQGE